MNKFAGFFDIRITVEFFLKPVFQCFYIMIGTCLDRFYLHGIILTELLDGCVEFSNGVCTERRDFRQLSFGTQCF